MGAMYALWGLIGAGTVAVVVTASSLRSLLVRIVCLGVVALGWLPITSNWMIVFIDPEYRKDFLVGSVLTFWVFMTVALGSAMSRLFVLLWARAQSKDRGASR